MIAPASINGMKFRRVLLLSLTILAIAMPVSAAKQPADIKRKQEDLQSLRDRIKSIESSLTRVREDQSSLAAAVREAEQEISAMSTAIRELDGQIQARAKESEKLTVKRDAIQQSLNRQLNLLGKQVRSSYVSGRQQKMKMLLNQEDPAVLGRLLAYYEYMVDARTDRIEAIQLELIDLVELEAALRKELENLQALREERTAQLAALEAKRGERNARLTSLEKDIKSSGKELSQLKQQEQALENLIEALKDNLQIPEEFRNAKPFASSKGRLPWPMRGRILARYGQSKRGTSLKWNGIWVGAKTGTPVRAVSTGRIVYVGWLHRYGLMVVMEHPGGYYSLYGHNQEAAVAVGDSVKAGQIVARAGDSGGHRKSGVYFEIRKGKRPVNPMAWLKR